MKISCHRCGKRVEAKRPTRKYCSDTCRIEACKERKSGKKSDIQAVQTPVDDSELVSSVRSELEELGQAESALGRQALTMANLLGSVVTGHATISKELSRLLDEARLVAPRAVEPLDELAERRGQRRSA
jgi:endogenous inhibitor of DNA gyrase (YacG/DUF329 family)